MDVAIIKYNAGNIQSVLYALQRLGKSAVVTDDHTAIKNADKVIFPGVGNAGAAMSSIKEKGLDVIIRKLQQPVLGICVGMQLMCNHSEEDDTSGLGIINIEVKKFSSDDKNFKVPHVGWNTIQNYNSPILAGVDENSFVYYVHSYYACIGDATVATTDYISPYSAVVQKNNFYGVQFHTEKSAETGEKILLNFLNLK